MRVYMIESDPFKSHEKNSRAILSILDSYLGFELWISGKSIMFLTKIIFYMLIM